MITYLSGAVHDGLPGPGIGYMLTPSMGNRPDLTGIPWAADNGCFSQGEGFRLEKFLSWLDSMSPWRSTCLFAVAPDVVGDAAATWERSEPVLKILREKGWPAALVAQDGLGDRLALWDRITGWDDFWFWDHFDALFIGGTTEFKLSEEVKAICNEARHRGKWIHMGRVNSRRRLATAAEFGCNSADGTYAAFRFRRKTGIEVRAEIMGWLECVHAQPAL
jgi:hypothetical protein